MSPALDKQLCRLAVMLCMGEEMRIRRSFMDAVSAGLSQSVLREVILTAYLFDGYPTALEGFRLLFDITETDTEKNDQFKYTADNVRKWRSRGMPLYKKIYGDQSDKLADKVNRFAPELADAMIVEGYGKVLSRSALEIGARELCIVSILAYKNRPRQLLSHALGALRVGIEKARLELIPHHIRDLLPSKDVNSAIAIIRQAIEKA